MGPSSPILHKMGRIYTMYAYTSWQSCVGIHGVNTPHFVQNWTRWPHIWIRVYCVISMRFIYAQLYKYCYEYLSQVFKCTVRLRVFAYQFYSYKQRPTKFHIENISLPYEIMSNAEPFAGVWSNCVKSYLQIVRSLTDNNPWMADYSTMSIVFEFIQYYEKQVEHIQRSGVQQDTSARQTNQRC